MKKLLVAVAAGVLLIPVLGVVTASPAMAQPAQQSTATAQNAVLSTTDAQRVSAEMGVSLESAVSNGWMAPSAPGASTFVVTEAGAAQLGLSASVVAGLSPFQITAIAAAVLANVVGLGVVIFDDGPDAVQTPDTPDTPDTVATPATP